MFGFCSILISVGAAPVYPLHPATVYKDPFLTSLPAAVCFLDSGRSDWGEVESQNSFNFPFLELNMLPDISCLSAFLLLKTVYSVP